MKTLIDRKSRLLFHARAYRHDWCGLGDRVIVHPNGLPPGWKESNLTPEEEAVALRQAEPRFVVHLEVGTGRHLEAFKLA